MRPSDSDHARAVDDAEDHRVQHPESMQILPARRTDADRWPIHTDPMARYDGLARKQPRPYNAVTGLFRSVPRTAFMMFPQVVPLGRYARLSGRVMIRCPCGSYVNLEDYAMAECATCTIAYANLGTQVRAGRHPPESEDPVGEQHDERDGDGDGGGE